MYFRNKYEYPDQCPDWRKFNCVVEIEDGKNTRGKNPLARDYSAPPCGFM
jgi:hypothetical protein